MARVVGVILSFALVVGVLAQPAITPKVGSPLRKSILDALRVPVEKRLKQKVIFQVSTLNVVGDWAYVQATPRQPNGKPIYYKGTEFEEAIKEGAFDDGAMSLLKRVGGKWKVIEVAIGNTDFPALDWIQQHHAPRSLIPKD